MNILKNIFVFVFAIIYLSACKPDKNNVDYNNSNNNTNNTVNNPLKLNISEPENNNFQIGNIIKISSNIVDLKDVDTVFVFINDNKTSFITKDKNEYSFDTKNSKPGNLKIEISAKVKNESYKQSKSVILISDIEPENYTFKIKNTYKHDVSAFTQGLFFSDGVLYEATGLKGESTVRKVKLETGEVLQSFAIDKNVFGEGICMFKDKIIQITWQDQKGFVYDMKSFSMTDQFSYIGEGWGITSDGNVLYMSDGSEIIKIIEPNNYSQTDKIEVYDNKGKVLYLNELEYINGEIFANIYQYEKIARIDPKTGKVLAYIDLTHILPFNDYNTNTDVLNGIAFDKTKNRLFVTGKKWPKLFEIELIKK